MFENLIRLNKIKKKLGKRYSFKESDYKDSYVFLKRLEDGRIFYNNQIYEKDFFDYERLEHSMKIFYNIRNEYINTKLKKLVLLYEGYYYMGKNERTREDIECMLTLPRLMEFNAATTVFDITSKTEWENLTHEQFIIIRDGYTFEFIYGNQPIKNYMAANYYHLGWKCIKPVFCAFKDADFRHYDDDNNYRTFFDPLDSGTFAKPEWLEYDEKKKYNEFDIYSKTNTYTKYNIYNDVYYKDYEGEKFSTKSNFDFTEEEIKANFDNMVNNKTIVKFNHVMQNEKNKRYLDEFTDKLIKYENKKKGDCGGIHRYTFAASEEVKNYRYSMLNDPRNLLVLPLIDSFMELYRLDGLYDGDNTFTDYPYDNKIHAKMVFYYDISVEYQEFCADRGWFYEDYTDIITDEEFDEKEDYFYVMGSALFVFYWSIFFLLWYMGYFVGFPNQVNINNYNYEDFYNFYINNKPHLYYDLVKRKGRCTIPRKELSPSFYSDCNLVFNRRRGRGFLPYSILDTITIKINNHDFLVRKMAYYLWNFGTFLGFR